MKENQNVIVETEVVDATVNGESPVIVGNAGEGQVSSHYVHVDGISDNDVVGGTHAEFAPADIVSPIQGLVDQFKQMDDLQLPVDVLTEEEKASLRAEVDKYYSEDEMSACSYMDLRRSKKHFDKLIMELDRNWLQLERISQLKKLYPDNPMLKHFNDKIKLTEDGEACSAEDFLSSYSSEREKLTYANSLIEARLETFKDQEKKSSFITNVMISDIEKKIELIDNQRDMNKIEKKKVLSQLLNSKAAYIDRVGLSYIKTNVSVANPKFVKDVNRMIAKGDYDKLIANSIDILDGIMTPEQVSVVEDYLNENYTIFRGPAMIINYMARALKSSASAGNHTWYKLFFMNIIDIYLHMHGEGEFDLEGGVEAAKKSIDEIVVHFEVVTRRYFNK